MLQNFLVKANSHVKELKHESWDLSLGLFGPISQQGITRGEKKRKKTDLFSW